MPLPVNSKFASLIGRAMARVMGDATPISTGDVGSTDRLGVYDVASGQFVVITKAQAATLFGGEGGGGASAYSVIDFATALLLGTMTTESADPVDDVADLPAITELEGTSKYFDGKIVATDGYDVAVWPLKTFSGGTVLSWNPNGDEDLQLSLSGDAPTGGGPTLGAQKSAYASGWKVELYVPSVYSVTSPLNQWWLKAITVRTGDGNPAIPGGGGWAPVNFYLVGDIIVVPAP